MDSHAARAELPAVEHEVVRQRPHREQVLARAVRSSSRSSGCGIGERVVRGIGRPSSSSASNSGKSTTQQEAAARPRAPAGGRGRGAACRARGRRAGASPATMSTRSPGAAPSASTQPELLGLATGTSATGDSSAPPSRDPHPHEAGRAELLGPVDQLVEAARGRRRPRPGTRMPFTHVGLERPELGGREHLARGRRARGRSGGRACRCRSAPSPRATSCAGIGPGASPVTASAAASTASADHAPCTSSASAKLISASSCMNSNCRSARRSSSRRQRAIW